MMHMRRRTACVVLWCLVAAWPLASWTADNETVNSLPSSTPGASSFSDIRTMLQNELPDILGRYFPTDWVRSGGTHATAGTCTSSAFAVEAWTSSGNRVTADSAGGTVAIDYSAVGCTCTNPGSDTAHVAVCASAPGSNFTRVGSSNYYVNCTDAAPATPTDCSDLMDVTITNGAIATVTDTRTSSPFPLRTTTTGLPSPAGPGSLSWVTDTIRGLWGYTGTQWFQLPGRWVNIQEFGAIPNDGIDDRAAIQAAIDAAETSGAGVWCPAGTYHLTRHPTESLALEMKSNMTFAGAGMDQCILTLIANQTRFTRVFSTRNSTTTTDITIRDLTIDGDYPNQNDGSGRDQQHGIFIGCVGGSTQRVFVNNVRITRTGGDGIGIYGESTNRHNAILTNIFFEDTDRSGIGILGNGARSVVIANNYFETFLQSAIDFEPTITGGQAEDVVITGNVFRSGITTGPNVTLGGDNATDRAKRVVFSNNIMSGTLDVIRIEDVSITGNIIYAGSTTTDAILLNRVTKRALVADNILVATTATSAGVRVVGTGAEFSDNVIIRGNRVNSYSHGVEMATCSDCLVQGNILIGSGTASTRGVQLNANLGNITNVQISGNLIKNFNTNCMLITRTGANTINGLVITNNICDDDQGGATQTSGIVFGVSAELFVSQAMISGNVFGDDISTPFTSLGTLSFLLAGQRGAVGFWSGSGTPEGALTAPVGNFYSDRAGSESSTVWYKGSGSGNTGWRRLTPIVASGSATFNPSSLADGAGETTTITVTGAALGDYAEVSFSLDLQGITLTGWVSAPDTVSARFQNESGGVLDLASGTLRGRASRQ